MYNLVEDEPACGPALPPYITSSLNSYPKETQHDVIRQVVQQAPLLKETVTVARKMTRLQTDWPSTNKGRRDRCIANLNVA
ncbi:hypothetical protein NW754_009652 [Fusarium falciforme]|nr:hypothetical protein NW754_009652 [Fusarium falciforme]KAJ4176829.1 hypothetical protein NW767_015316 [Fusarium falciforme]